MFFFFNVYNVNVGKINILCYEQKENLNKILKILYSVYKNEALQSRSMALISYSFIIQIYTETSHAHNVRDFTALNTIIIKNKD